MSENQTQAVVLTKEEKIARIDEQIAKLQQRRYNIENDIVSVAKPKAEVVLPEVGADVLFTYGRRTPTTEPHHRLGRVVAVKPAAVGENGKKLPAQIKVQLGDGFDASFAVIYPAQIVSGLTASE